MIIHRNTLLLMLMGSLAVVGHSVQAAPLVFSNEPLYLETGVDPNIFFEVDDSGSMDFEIQTGPYWRWCAYDKNYPGVTANSSDCDAAMISDGNFQTAVKTGSSSYTSINFSYIFKSGDTLTGDTCSNNDYAAIESCGANYIPNSSTTSNDWRVLNADFNALYYDSTQTYTFWQGTGLVDQTFASARSYPQPAIAAVSAVTETAVVDGVPAQAARAVQAGYAMQRDLGAANNWLGGRTGFEYHVWSDTHGFSGGRPHRGNNINRTTGANGIVDYWDEHVRYRITSSAIYRATITYTVAADGTITENVSESTVTTDDRGRSLAAAQTNIANWYSYSRRRMLAARGAVGAVIADSRSADFRFGGSVINRYTSFFNTVPPASVTRYTGYNKSLLNDLYSFQSQFNSTPLRTALRKDGLFYSNSISTYSSSLTSKVPTNPVIAACQQNYTIMLTDGYWNESFSSIADSDGDGVSSTLADVANYYATRDLQTGLANQVPIPRSDGHTFQHMELFGVSFGVDGSLVDNNSDGLPDHDRSGATFTPAKNVRWGDVSTNLGKIDDLWHATYNATPSSLTAMTDGSAKRFIAATNPASVVTGLFQALANIQLSQASSASVAASSGSLRDQTAGVFQARYKSPEWWGNLLRFPFNSDGTISDTASWEAKNTVAAQNFNTGRVITTFKPSSRTGIAFRWPASYASPTSTEMDSTQVTAILSGASTGQQAFGQLVVNYLRGDHSNEGIASSQFRSRDIDSSTKFVLGDIADSNPAYYGAPNLDYPDTLETAAYSTFATTWANRTPLVFAGANDGMLHIFNANNGQEVFGYVPSKVYSNLTWLTSKLYTHKYYVNGSPLVADAFYGGDWHTLVLGGLNQGGQGIYALDVTNPASFTEANASTVVRWEFTDTASVGTAGAAGSNGDPDLGYTFSRPAVGKVKTGTDTYKWVAVFGNGYNNVTADGSASTSTTGNAALYIVDIETGLLLKKISLPVTGDSVTNPNGLSTPALVDYDGDYVYDYVYAGDLKGNMWKIDLSGGSTASWKVPWGTATAPKPLFTGNTGQPITAAPVVGRHPQNAGVLVYFGTGKFLENIDNTRTSRVTQSFYAVWDNLSSTANVPYSPSSLLQQTITSQSFFVRGDTYEIRAISNNAMDWTAKKGWRIDFISGSSNNGELLAARPVLRNGRIIFVSWVPGEGGCAGGGDSWLWELNAYNGNPLKQPPFDLNNDGQFDSSDAGNTSGGNSSDGAWRQSACADPAGCMDTNGMFTSPTVLSGTDSDKKIMSSSTGAMVEMSEDPSAPDGRQSWRQIR